MNKIPQQLDKKAKRKRLRKLKMPLMRKLKLKEWITGINMRQRTTFTLTSKLILKHYQPIGYLSHKREPLRKLWPTRVNLIQNQTVTPTE